MRISFNWLREFVDTPEDAREVGQRLTEVGVTLDAFEVQGDDTIFDFDITANRGDCLSHLGVAREAAVIFATRVRLPETSLAGARVSNGSVEVSIRDAALCGRYTARVIRGVTVGPSPERIVRRLESAGIRSVNNIADITNYVLLELGHPMHAFDLDRMRGDRVFVRRAARGETLDTLDGVTRPLDPDMLVIADSERPIALAGIMGGQATEISGSTHNILLESAWFDPRTIRATATALNLGTEASYRFERGTDPDMAATASDRATRLILELAGGSLATELVDSYPGKTTAGSLRLRRTRIAGYLGSSIPDADVVSILEGLQFGVESQTSGWEVTCPSYRHDISREEDLLEELARHHGYERFPSTLPSWAGEGRGLPWQQRERATRDALSGLGYSEICTLAFSDPDTERIFAPSTDPVVLRNPLSEEEPILRTSLIGSMLLTLRWNLNRGIRDLKLYELGKVYPAQGEHRRLILALTGAVRPQSVHSPMIEAGFFHLKGDVESLLGSFGLAFDADTSEIPDYYHPGRAVRVGDVGILGELAEQVRERFRIRQRVYIAEIEIEALYEGPGRTIAVLPIPKYPRIRRDFSLILDKKIRFSDVVRAIRSAGIQELVGIVPFDRLEEGPFPESSYGLAVALEYQSADRTLTDVEVEEYDQRVLSSLRSIGAKLRG